MDVTRTELQSIYANIVESLGYKTTVGPTDKGKVTKAAAGVPSPRPKAKLACAAFDVAKILHPIVPPTPTPVPPPAPKLVAPITVREEGGSDQRVCLFANGELRPGVVRLPNGQYTDDSGARYNSDGDGLEDSSIRSKVTDSRLVGARSMDGRSACDCPPVGNPLDNTGSWTV